MAEQEQNRSEQASPHKLREARQRGQVPRSTDLPALSSLVVLWAALYFLGRDALYTTADAVGNMLSISGNVSMHGDTALLAAMRVAGPVATLLVAIMIVAMLVAVLTGLLQSGPVLSAAPLKPDFDKINPVSGLRRLFSLRLVIEAVKSSLKLAVLGGALYFFMRDHWLSIGTLSATDPRSLGETIVRWGADLMGAMLVWLTAIALIDLSYSRWDYAQKLRMSRREMKDEAKQREGDPRIRARARELRREFLKRSASMQRIKDADVLITNPVHLAVGMRYRSEEGAAPRVIVKGSGEIASMMRAFARRAGIPIVRDPEFARTLFRSVDLEREVPEVLYLQAARALAPVVAARRPRP